MSNTSSSTKNNHVQTDRPVNVEESFRTLLKRNQYINSSYELYGSPAGFQTYGALGASLKRRVFDLWRSIMCPMRSTEAFSIYEIDTPIIGPENVFIASGHVARFTDPVVKDKDEKIERVDHYLKARLRSNTQLSDEKKEGIINTLDDLSNIELQSLLDTYGEPERAFGKIYEQNLMLDTRTSLTNNVSYLRPETAQGLFVEFKSLYKFNNEELPFGIAQIGRVYRKEISPRPFVRLREFEQAEIEVFYDPTSRLQLTEDALNTVVNVFSCSDQESGSRYEHTASAKTISHMVKNGLNTFIAYFMYKITLFVKILGVPSNRIRFRQHLKNELAHYSSDCWDMEYLVRDQSVELNTVHPNEQNWIEVIGIADRGCYDLTQHQTASGSSMLVRRKYDPPITREVVTTKFNMKLFAKVFRDESQSLKTFIEQKCQSDPDFVDEFIRNNAQNNITTVVMNNNTYSIGPDLVNVEKLTKNVTYDEFVPHVIEPSFGVDRLLYTVLNSRYWVRSEDTDRAVLSIAPVIAPIQVVVLPLFTKDLMMKHVPTVVSVISQEFSNYKVDCSGASIGKRYSRADEIGVPFAITIDHQTDEDQTVTVRSRDDTSQERVRINDLVKYLKSRST